MCAIIQVCQNEKKEGKGNHSGIHINPVDKQLHVMSDKDTSHPNDVTMNKRAHKPREDMENGKLLSPSHR